MICYHKDARIKPQRKFMQEEQFVQIRKHIDPFYEVVEDRGVWFALLSSDCFFFFE